MQHLKKREKKERENKKRIKKKRKEKRSYRTENGYLPKCRGFLKGGRCCSERAIF
jgi:hypothetical protein